MSAVPVGVSGVFADFRIMIEEVGDGLVNADFPYSFPERSQNHLDVHRDGVLSIRAASATFVSFDSRNDA
jgi:hypothetical protein